MDEGGVAVEVVLWDDVSIWYSGGVGAGGEKVELCLRWSRSDRSRCSYPDRSCSLDERHLGHR